MPRRRVTLPTPAWDNRAPGPFLFSAIERPNTAPDLTWGFVLPGRPVNTPNTVRVRAVGDDVYLSLDTIPQADRRQRC